jgi:hypothetical protein
MLGLLPLVFGHNNVEIWVQDKLPAPLAQQLANENAGVRDDDHSGSARRKSNSPANSSSLMPVSWSTCSTASPSLTTAPASADKERHDPRLSSCRDALPTTRPARASKERATYPQTLGELFGRYRRRSASSATAAPVRVCRR